MPIITTTKTLQKRHPYDFYPTPVELVRATTQLLPENFVAKRGILDIGSGTGVWGDVYAPLFPKVPMIGVEIQPFPCPISYTTVYTQDFFTWKAPQQFDLIIGNVWYSEAEAIFRKAFTLLTPDGVMIQLLRLAFLEGQKRTAGFWKEFPPSEVHVLGKRPSFTGNGKTDATAYAVYVWRGTQLPTSPSLHWLEWDYDD